MRALMVLLVVLTAAPAGAVDLVTAAARVRVGDAVGAVEVLGLDPPKDEDARAVWGVLRARAHLLVGDGGGAREALDAVALPEPLVAVGYWLRLQAAVERGDDAAVKDLAGALLTREDAPQRLRDEATLRLAATQGAAGVPALMTLADHPVLGARPPRGIPRRWRPPISGRGPSGCSRSAPTTWSSPTWRASPPTNGSRPRRGSRRG
jgi:hypothetical protein